MVAPHWFPREDADVNHRLPPPWEPIDDHFYVRRCGVLIGGRRPSSPDVVQRWFKGCTGLFEELGNLGVALPKLHLSRWDPTRDKVVTSQGPSEALAGELSQMFALGLDGSLALDGEVKGRVPEGPFVYAADCWARLDAPDWISYGVDLSFITEFSTDQQTVLTQHLVRLVRAAASDPSVHYAEVSPQNLHGLLGATSWEDSLEQDCFGAGLRLAPRWLRGFGSATFVHNETLDTFSDRQALRDSKEFESVISCPSGVLFVARANLWREDVDQDARIRELVDERLLESDLLERAMALAAEGATGPNASELDQHFRALGS